MGEYEYEYEYIRRVKKLNVNVRNGACEVVVCGREWNATKERREGYPGVAMERREKRTRGGTGRKE